MLTPKTLDFHFSSTVYLQYFLTCMLKHNLDEEFYISEKEKLFLT